MRGLPVLLTALPSLLLLAGCGGSHPPGGDQDAGAGDPSPNVEHLRSLGYVSWDDRADPSLAGVTLLDERRASPGVNLHTNDEDRVYLSDLQGRTLREWRVPGGKRQCEYAVLLADGDLVVECVDQSVTRLRPDSTVVWDLALPAHHDVDPREDGSLLVPFIEDHPWEGRSVGFDGIALVSAGGSPSRLWSTWERFDELRGLHRPSPLDVAPGDDGDPLAGREEGFEYYHLNSVEILRETPLGERDSRFRAGNLLVCLRNVNLIAVLDQQDLSVVWSWGAGDLELPHMPSMLPNGNILVFDNGTYRGWSRVLEIEPPTGRKVWSYEGSPRESFFSKWRGGAQRLPNGNTLICESERGHVFEVTPEGGKVWELWNPEIVEGRRKRIYRFTRLDPSAARGLLDRVAGGAAP